MNYFAHGHRFVDDPYFLAGTAVPDWLSVVDRKVRVRAAQRDASPTTPMPGSRPWPVASSSIITTTTGSTGPPRSRTSR